MDWMSLVLGSTVGYIIARVVNRITLKSAVVKTITVAQIQSLRLLSRSINHFYKLV